MTEFQALQQWARNCWLAGIPLAEARAMAGAPWAGMIARLTQDQVLTIAIEQAALCQLFAAVAPADKVR